MSTVDPSSRRPGELRNACASNARLVFGSIPNSHFPDPEISVWMRAFVNTVQSCRTTRSRELLMRIVLGVIAHGACHADRLARQTPFAEKLARPEYRDDCLFAGLVFMCSWPERAFVRDSCFFGGRTTIVSFLLLAGDFAARRFLRVETCGPNLCFPCEGSEGRIGHD